RRRAEIMPTAQAVYIASKMCEGLDYAHRKKDARGKELHIIHRDVSPQNVLVSYEGEVKLIDFGIAKATNRSQKTQAGTLKGKFGYMSPEQVRGFEIDRRSDVFAVGVLLYEMLTGAKLFAGESDFSTLEKVRNAEVPLPTGINPNIPAGLEKVVLKALAREPEDRYQWPSDLHEDLMRYLVAGDQVYSSKHLAGFMKSAFAEDLLREQERMERFAAIEKPEQLETSGLRAVPLHPAPRRKGSESETPAGGARPLSGAAGSSGSAWTGKPIPLRISSTQATRAALATPLASAPVERTHVFEEADSGGAAAPINGRAAAETQEAPAPAWTDGDDAAATRMLTASEQEGDEDSGSDPAPGRGSRAKTIALVAAAVAGLAALGATLAAVLSPASAASVVVTVDPAEGAQISINGAPASSGKPLTLSPGQYQIEASAPGRQLQKRVVTLAAGENGPIAFALPPVEAGAVKPVEASGGAAAPDTFTARFVANVPDVEIAVGDRPIGATPQAVATELEVGKTYRFTAHKEGFKPYQGEFTGQTAGELQVSVALVAETARPPANSAERERDSSRRSGTAQSRKKAVTATGGLACSTRPAGAEVLVDGKPTGRVTPVALGNPVMVPVGNRVIQFKMAGKKSAARMVEIKAGEVARLVNVPLE
ncbi:MAG TPA: serine/threonine-protein kinase, partial [Myxococcaceae bacterium]|nr:serine/threonine-protein kinase [Myxococcaceae bacterium]